MGAFLDKPITTKTTSFEDGTVGGPIRYVVCSMQGWRAHMEDSHVNRIGIPLTRPNSTKANVESIGFFGVFDGHGGSLIANNAANIAVETFAEAFKNASGVADSGPITNQVLSQVIQTTFLLMDERMKELPQIKRGEDSSGCTAVCALITPDAYIIANAGDSRCVVVGAGGKIRFASTDHKPDLPEEVERISKAGGYVSMRRVNGDLAVSRCLGDYLYKRDPHLPAEAQQISPLPDVTIIPRLADDQLLLLACDGIWDVLSNEDAANYLLDKLSKGIPLGRSSEMLIDHCLEMNSRDNMSIIAVALPAAYSNLAAESKPEEFVTSEEGTRAGESTPPRAAAGGASSHSSGSSATDSPKTSAPATTASTSAGTPSGSDPPASKKST